MTVRKVPRESDRSTCHELYFQNLSQTEDKVLTLSIAFQQLYVYFIQIVKPYTPIYLEPHTSKPTLSKEPLNILVVSVLNIETTLYIKKDSIA